MASLFFGCLERKTKKRKEQPQFLVQTNPLVQTRNVFYFLSNRKQVSHLHTFQWVLRGTGNEPCNWINCSDLVSFSASFFVSGAVTVAHEAAFRGHVGSLQLLAKAQDAGWDVGHESTLKESTSARVVCLEFSAFRLASPDLSLAATWPQCS